VRSIENDDVTPKNCKPYKSGTHGFVLDLNAAEFTIKFYNFLSLLLGTILILLSSSSRKATLIPVLYSSTIGAVKYSLCCGILRIVESTVVYGSMSYRSTSSSHNRVIFFGRQPDTASFRDDAAAWRWSPFDPLYIPCR
jgi:hypothetical protein